MESSNIYEQHQQLQQQLAAYYSSLAAQSAHDSNVNVQDWNHSIMLNRDEDYNRYMNETLQSSKQLYATNTSLIPLVQNSLLQETGSSTVDGSSSIFDQSQLKFKQQQNTLLDLNENIIHGGFGYTPQSSTTSDYSNMGMAMAMAMGMGMGMLSPPFVSTSSGLNLSMAALSCINNGELCSRNSSRSHSHVTKTRGSSSHSSKKSTLGFRNGASKPKRQVNNFNHAKPSHEEASNSPALSQSSSQGLKVRKEKLGDRIAALHRLVAPFGKTDTASVLTEAIGYIQFLQDQIHTLSVSYNKPSRIRRRRTIQTDPTMENEKEDEGTQSLRSRGLCLVPMSLISYMSSYTGGDM